MYQSAIQISTTSFICLTLPPITFHPELHASHASSLSLQGTQVWCPLPATTACSPTRTSSCQQLSGCTSPSSPPLTTTMNGARGTYPDWSTDRDGELPPSPSPSYSLDKHTYAYIKYTSTHTHTYHTPPLNLFMFVTLFVLLLFLLLL